MYYVGVGIDIGWQNFIVNTEDLKLIISVISLFVVAMELKRSYYIQSNPLKTRSSEGKQSNVHEIYFI